MLNYILMLAEEFKLFTYIYQISNIVILIISIMTIMKITSNIDIKKLKLSIIFFISYITILVFSSNFHFMGTSYNFITLFSYFLLLIKQGTLVMFILNLYMAFTVKKGDN
ncbi:hypothetical protein JXR93_05655 [bacterium]|nr:hypothetical protein [bacterium]